MLFRKTSRLLRQVEERGAVVYARFEIGHKNLLLDINIHSLIPGEHKSSLSGVNAKLDYNLALIIEN